jgi:hypothetical protein
MTFIDELRAVSTRRHVIADNLLRSTHPCASGARDEINRMWNWYRQLAEHDFPLRFATDPQSKYWEMYLACTLKDVGFQVRRKEEGPDFWIESDRGRIWIEAIAPEPGDGAKPDFVPEPVVNQVSDMPVRQIVLRLTSAIHDKQKKLRQYQLDGTVGENDCCVIALSPAKIRYPVTTDFVQRAVYEAGDLYVSFDRTTLKTIEQGRQHEPKITKRNTLTFSKPSFVDASCSHVSALLLGGRGIGNMPPLLGSDCGLFHNHMALHPLRRGWLRRGSEHWIKVDDESIHLESHSWNDSAHS